MAASKISEGELNDEIENYSNVNEETEKMCSKSNHKGRKIVPDLENPPPGKAWDGDMEANISMPPPLLIDREMSTPYGCKHHRKNFNVAENGVGNGHIKYYDQYEHLLGHTPYKYPPMDRADHSITLNIIKNVRNKKKKQKSQYLKYFCPPYFILIVSILEIAIFVWDSDKVERLLMYSPHNRDQAWRFLSYMLVHSGSIHLTLNIIIQTMLATPLEFEQGWWRCCVVYLGGGLIGAIGASILQPTLYMVGASAGVYALLTSHLANVLLRFSTLKYRIFRIFAVAVLAGSDVAFSVAHGQIAGDGSPKIGWASHCAGAVAGFTLGLLFYTGSDSGTTYIKATRYLSLIFIIIICIVGVLGNIFFIDLKT